MVREAGGRWLVAAHSRESLRLLSPWPLEIELKRENKGPLVQQEGIGQMLVAGMSRRASHMQKTGAAIALMAQ